MSCPHCGQKVGDKDTFCSACGKRLSANQEAVLHSFGPWGTGVCFSRPGFFTVIHNNDTKIVLTERCISGYSSFTNSTRFQVPYEAITATELFDYLLWKVLWIQYREKEKTREVSIMGTVTNHRQITQAFNLVRTHLN